MENSGLKRSLTLVTVFTLITGAMVGMAWAVLPNILFGYAGPALLLSVVIAAAFCMFIGLCYAELCAAMPFAGGEYHYTKVAMGKFFSFITGWFLVVAYSAMMPGEIIILSKVLAMLITSIPKWLIGIILALIFGGINLIGIRISAVLQFVFSLVLFLGMAIFIFGGWGNIHWENFTPFFDGHVGGMLMMVPIGMLAFMGFDIVPQAAEEVKSPINKVVYMIPLSIAFVCFFYVGAFFTAAGNMPPAQIAQIKAEVPLIEVAKLFLGDTGAMIILVAGIMGLITTLNAFVIGASRLMLGMAREGVLPESLAKVSQKYGTPYWAIILITFFGILGAIFQQLFMVFQIASSAILIAFILVIISFIILRKKRPDMERPYVVPLYPLTPIIALFGSIAAFLFSLISFESWIHWVIFGAATILGLFYYVSRVKNRELKETMTNLS
ncbi:MAG: amino acid permease [Deltaproteobacteria bacterium]|nr:amino acid permease [Deltaproteobacteria bacterium]